VWFVLPGVVLTLYKNINCDNEGDAKCLLSKKWSNGRNALTLSPLDAAAPSLICWKVPGWRTVTAAVSVAKNKVVVELTNMSFANFVVLDMKKMQLMMK
jgi:hypothetical protein